MAERTEKAETTSSQVLHTIGFITFHRGQSPQIFTPVSQSFTAPSQTPRSSIARVPGGEPSVGPLGGPTKDLRRGSPVRWADPKSAPGTSQVTTQEDKSEGGV